MAKPASLAAIEKMNKLPPLAAVCVAGFQWVVSEQTGLSGGGFVAAEEIPAAQQRVFGFDGMEHGCRLPDDLQNAVGQRPSNGIQVNAAK